MFSFTVVENSDSKDIITFYNHLVNVKINKEFNFIVKNKECYHFLKSLKLSTNILLHEKLEKDFLADIVSAPQQILYINYKNILAKDPIPFFQQALTKSEIVYYETKNNKDFFGANYSNDFKFYYPDLIDDYEMYLQKNEGNIYTLPSCGLTTTESLID